MDHILSIITDEIGSGITENLPFLREQGIRQIELRSIEGRNIATFSEEEVRALKKMLDDNGLTVCAIASPLFKWYEKEDAAEEAFDSFGFPSKLSAREKSEAIDRVISHAHILGCKKIRIFSNVYEGKPDAAKAWNDPLFAEAIERISNAGLSPLLENELPCHIFTLDDVEETLKRFPKLSLWFDGVYFVRSGDKITPDVLRRLLPRIHHVHMKDFVYTSEDEGVRHVPLGTGVVPWGEHLKVLLAEAPHPLTFSLESHVTENRLDAAAQSFAYFRSILQEGLSKREEIGMNINIISDHVPPNRQDIEIVERKGIGHPDTFADNIAETMSVNYSRYCLAHFGHILHHNVDKAGVLGGLGRIEWGSDEMRQPIRLLLPGRVSRSFSGEAIPVDELYEEAARQVIARTLPHVDASLHIKFLHQHTDYSSNPRWFNPRGVEDLPEARILVAGDTCAMVGASPYTQAERLTLALEGAFYKADGTPLFQDCGQDIKVMAMRSGTHFDIRVCFPVILKHCPDVDTYWAIQERTHTYLSSIVEQHLQGGGSYNLTVNTPRDAKNPLATPTYATVTGSAHDFGEEGLVGRGNNRMGIIPLCRESSVEAAAGKNPVYHAGKVLGFAADEISREIARSTGCANGVMVITKKGSPLMSPSQIIVRIAGNADPKAIEEIARQQMARTDLTHRIVQDGALIPETGNRILARCDACHL